MKRNVTEYKCDKCGAVKHVACDAHGMSDAPVGWSEATVKRLNAGERDPETSELCDGCTSKVLRYMQPDAMPDNGAEPRLRSDSGLAEVH